MSEMVNRRAVEWGVASRCRRGEIISGDLAVVAPLPDGALVAAIDGLGHGEHAARAAEAAGDVLRRHPSHDLVRLVGLCHDALHGTRGAAISLAFLSGSKSTLTWLGVGSVEGRVMSAEPSAQRAKSSLALARGVPGHELPALDSATLDIEAGDLLVMATDGVGRAFADVRKLSGSPQAIAERIIDTHWKSTDDALVVAVRFLGSRA